ATVPRLFRRNARLRRQLRHAGDKYRALADECGLAFAIIGWHKASIRLQPKSAAFCRSFPVLGSLIYLANVCMPSCMLRREALVSLRLRALRITPMATINGTVKFFNTTKGFGFITPENGGKDHFVHISAVQNSGVDGLYENDKVTYEVETGRDGRESAVNLTLVK